MTKQEIIQAATDYTGRKRLKDSELMEIAWFVKNKNLSVKEAVKAYFEDRKDAELLSHKEWLEEYEKYCKAIEEHCKGCKYENICVKTLMLAHRTRYDLKDLKTIFRSECWRN